MAVTSASEQIEKGLMMPDFDEKYFESSKEDQQEKIGKLWDMVVRFSGAEGASADERWRMAGIRLQAAIVSRVTGVMDKDTFCAETSRYSEILAGAMGGTAFSSEPTKTLIQIVLEIEARGHIPRDGLLILYDRELCGFRLDALREVVNRMEKEYPDSPRIKEMRDKIQYRETHGLIEGGM